MEPFENRILRVQIFNSCPLLFYPSPGPFCFVKGHFIPPDPSEFLPSSQIHPIKRGSAFAGRPNFVDPALLTPSTERSDIGLDYGRAGREPLGVASSSAVLPGAGIYPHFGDFVVMSRDWRFLWGFPFSFIYTGFV